MKEEDERETFPWILRHPRKAKGGDDPILSQAKNISLLRHHGRVVIIIEETPLPSWLSEEEAYPLAFSFT